MLLTGFPGQSSWLQGLTGKKPFSSETVGTVMWSWNLNPEKLKEILHAFYDMHESSSVMNEFAKKVNGKVAHCGPLFPGSRWWQKPLTSLPDHSTGKRKLLVLPSGAKLALRWWIIIFGRFQVGQSTHPGSSSSLPSLVHSYFLRCLWSSHAY